MRASIPDDNLDQVARDVGIDPNSLSSQLAEHNAESCFALIDTLRDRARSLGISQAQIASLLGVTEEIVDDFERLVSDPKMSTVRRYALAVGMEIDLFARPIWLNGRDVTEQFMKEREG